MNILEIARQYRTRRVAITGASGYLGSALAGALAGHAARMLLVSRRERPAVAGLQTLRGDVTAPDCWDTIVNADVVFHLAGNTSVYAAEQDPAGSLTSTVLPLTHLDAAARRAGRAPRVLYASTATVYGFTEQLPVDEDAPLAPVTTYDLHKAFSEQQLARSSADHIVDGVSLRLSNVYGPSAGTSSSADRGILNKVTSTALQGGEVRLYGGGNYLRDYVYIDDVVRAFLMAGIASGVSGQSFNVSSGRGVTVRDAFVVAMDRAARATGVRSTLRSTEWPANANPIEFRNYTASIERMARACGWAPAVTLSEGIDRLIAHFLAASSVRG